MSIPGPSVTDDVIEQGRALVKAIQALETIKPSYWVERGIAKILLWFYRRRLRGIIGSAPSWVGEKILSAAEGIGDDSPAVWMSKN
jgi:hypothetical protein